MQWTVKVTYALTIEAESAPSAINAALNKIALGQADVSNVDVQLDDVVPQGEPRR